MPLPVNCLSNVQEQIKEWPHLFTATLRQLQSTNSTAKSYKLFCGFLRPLPIF